MRQFGELEAVIMDRLWAWGRPASVREMVDDLQNGRQIAYTTVMTVMDNLYRKGWLRRHRDGRAWRYEPTVPGRRAEPPDRRLRAAAARRIRDAGRRGGGRVRPHPGRGGARPGPDPADVTQVMARRRTGSFC
jgi:hypothetical protein